MADYSLLMRNGVIVAALAPTKLTPQMSREKFREASKKKAPMQFGLFCQLSCASASSAAERRSETVAQAARFLSI